MVGALPLLTSIHEIQMTAANENGNKYFRREPFQHVYNVSHGLLQLFAFERAISRNRTRLERGARCQKQNEHEHDEKNW